MTSLIKNLTKVFLTLTIISFNIGIFGFAHAASTNELINEANTDRTQSGLTVLNISDKLTVAAQAKAKDMFNHGYFAHISPQGKTPWDFMTEVSYNYAYAGENLAIGYTNNQELNSAWMNSPTHRENILDKNFSEIGMAVVNGNYEGSQTTIVVQMFGAPMPVNQTVVPSVNSTQNSNSNPIDKQILSTDNSVQNSVKTNNSTMNPIKETVIIVVGFSVLFSLIYVTYRTQKLSHLVQ